MILSILIALPFLLLPVVLWGYFFSIVLDPTFFRLRWWIGVVIGSLVTMGAVWIGGWLTMDPWWLVGIFGLLLFGLSSLIALMLSYRESRQWGISTRHLILFSSHSLLFSVILGLSLWIGDIATTGILGGWMGAMLSASLEEGVKHIGGISSRMSRDRTRTILMILTISVVLGFAFVENLLYLLPLLHTSFSEFFWTWASRSLFSLSSHIFASLIVTYSWWRALEYGVFSMRYFLIVGLGAVTAISIHAGYNMIVEERILWLLFATWWGSMVGIGWILWGGSGKEIVDGRR